LPRVSVLEGLVVLLDALSIKLSAPAGRIAR
jgi:hypothetical protein